ncbi:manganese efflux pump MntP family protein [Siminovitchia fortis]|uniref:Putative manganese efflux pump MntP n=1 Tax=Siminovitchia fortis TaxID=254758 RepID=A0A443IYY9_9BACI|nr:manganese efflux pump MntP family protein [Siminovitchia fortis]RWR13465.1 manganese efflux pump [Siminovitchia fortis]WHY81702.1 manganese efflux pump MntP family protein [Siminovitchia fortis]
MWLPELVTLVIMAFAVGMDAFSVSLGMGTFKLRLRQIFSIGITIGLFHMAMPLLGIMTGHLLSATFGKITGYIGGMLLVIMGVMMIVSSFRNEEQTIVAPIGWGLLFFSMVVSLDSFSAGLSLGMFGAKAIAAMIIFGAVSAFLTWSGLILGRKVQNWLGFYGELLGGFILIVFGIKLVFIG